jgi:hypothetical protein
VILDFRGEDTLGYLYLLTASTTTGGSGQKCGPRYRRRDKAGRRVTAYAMFSVKLERRKRLHRLGLS